MGFETAGRKYLFYLILFLSFAVFAFVNAGGGKDISAMTERVGILKTPEVRNYRGTHLSSVNDFRENSIKGPQDVERNSYTLKITGLVKKPVLYSYDQVVRNHPHYEKVVRLDCVEGWSVTILWEGILVSDLIRASKPLPGAKIVIFHAYDGYTTSFPIEYIMKKNILMAYKMNNIVIPSVRGFPFELVAEGKWGYKWIKWITGIELSDNVNYRGYWESRGYSNDGDLNGSFFR